MIATYQQRVMTWFPWFTATDYFVMAGLLILLLILLPPDEE